MDVLKWLLIGLGVLLVLYGGLVVLGAWRWSLATRALVSKLDAADLSPDGDPYDSSEIAGLPAPVRRYLELVLTDGQPIIRAADIGLQGTFNMSLATPNWKRFTSHQHVVANRPGFVWDARIALFPGFPVRVHDAYVAGEGVLQPSILGLVSMGAVRGTGEIARGELMRWLAEAVWYPTALLPSQGVAWQAVDANSALATLRDGAIELTMLFRFGEDGLVSGIEMAARSGTFQGQTMMMPCEGLFRDYRAQHGMLIPFYGEVAWITPEGPRPYFRGTVMRAAYRFAQ